MSEYKSERTKKLEKSKVDKDMPSIKKAVRAGALGISRAADKVEGYFKGKEPSKDKPAEKKMAAGGLSSGKALRKGGSVNKTFKPCKGCPSPAKCKAAGKCLAKKAASGMLVIPVKMEKKSAPKKRK
jgi:hypothetical protein